MSQEKKLISSVEDTEDSKEAPLSLTDLYKLKLGGTVEVSNGFMDEVKNLTKRIDRMFKFMDNAKDYNPGEIMHTYKEIKKSSNKIVRIQNLIQLRQGEKNV
jgi:hypothetical protein